MSAFLCKKEQNKLEYECFFFVNDSYFGVWEYKTKRNTVQQMTNFEIYHLVFHLIFYYQTTKYQ